MRGGLRQRYCAHLRAGRAIVWVEPARAERHLEDARTLAGGALVVREEVELDALRALVSGDARAAHELFSSIPQYEGNWDAARAETELGRARAAFLSNELSSAGEGYAEVLLRLDELPSARDRARAFIEGALVAALGGQFPQADAYLSAARAEGAPLLTPVIAASRLYLEFRKGTPLAELQKDRVTLDQCASLGWILARQPRSRGAPGDLLPVVPERQLRELVALGELGHSVADAEMALGEAARDDSKRGSEGDVGEEAP